MVSSSSPAAKASAASVVTMPMRVTRRIRLCGDVVRRDRLRSVRRDTSVVH